MITWREIRIKYKQSLMGFLWALLMPLLIVTAGVLVRFAISRLSGVPVSIENVLSLSTKAIPWGFFLSSVRFATNSLTGNMNLVTKIYFPREIFPVSSVLAQLFDFLLAFFVFGIFLLAVGAKLSIMLAWVPCLIVLLLLLCTALGVLLSAANVFFRDVKYIVEVVLTFAIFFTPVLYEAEMAGEWEWVLLLNPVAPLLEGLRNVIVLQQPPEIIWVLYSSVVSILLVVFSIVIFKKLEPLFAEWI